MLDAEKCLIGCVLTDPKYGMNKIYNRIKVEMFPSFEGRETYNIFRQLFDKGEEITISEVARLLDNGNRDMSEITTFLSECINSVYSSVEIDGYAKLIETDYKVKRLRNMFQPNKVRHNNVDTMITELLKELEDLKPLEENPVITLAEASEKFKDKCFTEKAGEELIPTGFAKIDECIGGFAKGNLIVIGARPAVGKSAFVTQIIVNIAQRGYKVGFFNLEMTSEEIYQRVVARLSGIELQRIQRSKAFVNDEEERFAKANDEMSKLDNIDIVSSGNITTTDIKARTRHSEYDIIFVDYLQLVNVDRTYENRAQEVGAISKALKSLAMEQRIPVVALSQMNRKVNSTDEPTMSELRESGNVEQDASIIGLLWNATEDGKLKSFKIDKGRQNTTMKENLAFDGARMEFVEGDEPIQRFNTVDDEMEIPFD